MTIATIILSTMVDAQHIFPKFGAGLERRNGLVPVAVKQQMP